MDKSTVVDALCANLQIPGVGDIVERGLVTRAVGTVYDHIPPFVWEIVVDAADGISPGEIDDLIGGIARSISGRLKMPYLPEMFKEQIINQILNSLRTGLQVDARIEALTK